MAVVTVPYGPGETYLTLDAAVVGTAPYDLVTLGTTELVFEATSAFDDNNTKISITSAGFTTNPTHRVVVRPQAAFQHNGLPGTGYKISGTNWNNASDSPLLKFTTVNFTIEGVELAGGGEIGAGKFIILLYPTVSSHGILERCLIHGAVSGVGTGKGIQTAGSSTLVANNCAIYDNSGQGVLSIGSPVGGCQFVNCTVSNNSTYGFESSTPERQITVVACMAHGNTLGDSFTNAFTLTGNGWNVSGDNSLPGSSFAIGYVDDPNGDFHLTSADAVLLSATGPSKTQLDSLVSAWLGFGTIWDSDLDVDKQTRKLTVRNAGYDEWFAVTAAIAGVLSVILSAILAAPLKKV